MGALWGISLLLCVYELVFFAGTVHTHVLCKINIQKPTTAFGRNVLRPMCSLGPHDPFSPNQAFTLFSLINSEKNRLLLFLNMMSPLDLCLILEREWEQGKSQMGLDSGNLARGEEGEVLSSCSRLKSTSLI